MITVLLFGILLVLLVISDQLEEAEEQKHPTRSHAEWTDGVWNGRP